MKSLSFFDKIFIHREPVDMRKSINGLSAIVDLGDARKSSGKKLIYFLQSPKNSFEDAVL